MQAIADDRKPNQKRHARRSLWTRIKWRLYGRMLRERELARALKEASYLTGWQMQLYFRNAAYRRGRWM